MPPKMGRPGMSKLAVAAGGAMDVQHLEVDSAARRTPSQTSPALKCSENNMGAQTAVSLLPTFDSTTARPAEVKHASHAPPQVEMMRLHLEQERDARAH